ncbi:MAG TPA: hypothetical protein VM166_07260 [Gemmatimonadaceae bacterium]|nr:hypothetical protein [Gemmatimonadaceae bacterium]
MINRSYLLLALAVSVGCGGSKDTVGPVRPSSDISSMNVGEVRVFAPADIPNGIQLPATSSGRDYIVIVGNTNSQQDAVANYVVRANRVGGVEPAQVSSGPSVGSGLGSVVLGGVDVPRTRQQSLDMKVRSFERSALRLRVPSGGMGLDRFALRKSASVATAPVPAVGDKLNLKIPDASTNDLCNNFIRTQAVVASVSRRAILAVDTLDGPPIALFSQAQLDSITAEYDNITYPTDSSYFGVPTDVDANGHVIILFTGQINKLTPPGQSSFIGGFFFAGDFFPATGTQPGQFCPQSNNAEIFYLLSPDPTGRFNNIRTTGSVRQGTRGTIAHEFQHMINAGNRFEDPNQCCFESTWLDEALAHLAEEAVGRVQRGFTDLQTLTLADLVPTGNQAANNDFNAFFFQNFARLTYWMQRPDTSSGISAHADQNLSSRGAAWSLVRYSADNYSNSNPRTFARKLAAGPDTGTKNLVVSAKAPLDTLVAGWLVANYADHLGISGLDPKYQFKAYNFRNIMPSVARSVTGSQSAVYPLQVLPIGSGTDNISSTNQTGSGTYYRLNVPSGSGDKTVKVLDPSGSLASFPGAHIYVLRVQ